MAQDEEVMGEPIAEEAVAYETTATPAPAARSKDAADNYELAYAARGLTMPQGMIRGTLGFTIGKLSLTVPFFGTISETTAALDIGAAISPLENLEIGFNDDRMGWPEFDFGARSLIPILLQPDSDVGDIPLYIRYRFLNTNGVEIAADLELNLPTATDFGILLGLPVRIKASEQVAIDTGAAFTVIDLGGENFTSVRIPLGLVANFTDNIFMKVQSGLDVVDLSDPGFGIPLRFGAGYTIEAGPTMVDLFGFPVLAAFADGESTTSTDIWTLSFGAKVYTLVLF